MFLDYDNIPDELEIFLLDVPDELRQLFLKRMSNWCCSRDWLELRIQIIRLITYALGAICFPPNASMEAEVRCNKRYGQHLVIWENYGRKKR